MFDPFPAPPLLDEVLRTVAHRYPVPDLPATLADAARADTATSLAYAIEQARLALARGEAPAAPLQALFVDALARSIGEALRPDGGDPAFQALLLRHRWPQVRAYASLAAHAEQDRRAARAAVNAVAHPAKWARYEAGTHRQALMALHAAAQAGGWPALVDAARAMQALPIEPPLRQALDRLLADPALSRLQRLAALADGAPVQRYRALQALRGPASGTPEAAARGNGAQQRGAAGESLAARALETLARRLGEKAPAGTAYRAVTSLFTPASLAAGTRHAKTEWDVALLREDTGGTAEPVAAICLLVEAKASADAATTDVPRMWRGLQCLAGAEGSRVYPFATKHGHVNLQGASLRGLVDGDRPRPGAVLYCCAGPAEPAPRLLSAASRMQLLSTPAALAFADALASRGQADATVLAPVWRELLEAPRFAAVLQQYATLRWVRSAMVHVEDLAAAIDAAGHGAG